LLPPAARARGDDEADLGPPRTLTLEVGGLAVGGGFGLELQVPVADTAALFVRPTLIPGFTNWSTPSPLDGLWGGGMRLGARFFPWGNAPAGFYAGPDVEADVLGGHRAGVAMHGWRVAGGAEVGFNWIPFELVDLSIGGGVLYRLEWVSGGASGAQGSVAPFLRLGAGFVF
jgi:hypothetical protein